MPYDQAQDWMKKFAQKSYAKKGDDIVSIVYKGKTRSDMYTLMNQILSTFAN